MFKFIVFILGLPSWAKWVVFILLIALIGCLLYFFPVVTFKVISGIIKGIVKCFSLVFKGLFGLGKSFKKNSKTDKRVTGSGDGVNHQITPNTENTNKTIIINNPSGMKDSNVWDSID